MLNKKLEAPFIPDHGSISKKKVLEEAAIACGSNNINQKYFDEF